MGGVFIVMKMRATKELRDTLIQTQDFPDILDQA